MYIWLKYIHILSAMIMIGTTAVNGVLELRSTHRQEAKLSAFTMEVVKLLNFALMLPSLILLPVSGLLLASEAGYSLKAPWLMYSIMLMFALWAAFITGHFVETQMGKFAAKSAEKEEALAAGYFRFARYGTWIGTLATIAALISLYMMVAKRPPFF